MACDPGGQQCSVLSWDMSHGTPPWSLTQNRVSSRWDALPLALGLLNAGLTIACCHTCHWPSSSSRGTRGKGTPSLPASQGSGSHRAPQEECPQAAVSLMGPRPPPNRTPAEVMEIEERQICSPLLHPSPSPWALLWAQCRPVAMGKPHGLGGKLGLWAKALVQDAESWETGTHGWGDAWWTDTQGRSFHEKGNLEDMGKRICLLFHEAGVDSAPTLCQAVDPAPEDAMISKTGLGSAFVELSVYLGETNIDQ